MNVIFGPAYSPDINPIKLYFNSLKQEVYKE